MIEYPQLYSVLIPIEEGIQRGFNDHGNHISAPIFDWLFERCGSYPVQGPAMDDRGRQTPAYTTDHFIESDALWDVCGHPATGMMQFMFKDSEHAMLFKLTWAGAATRL